MLFTESLEQAKALARMAMQRMDEYSIAANPANYTVWYTYNSGTEPALIRELDALVATSGITDDQTQALYNRHFGNGVQSKVLQETSQRIESAVGQLIGLVGEAGERTADYGETLVGYSGKLADSRSAEDVKAIVVGILDETRKMAEHHKQLEAQIDQSAQEINELRESMATARQEALTDALTGIANRKAFDEHVEVAIAEATSMGAPLSLLLLDIDHFKKFNDEHGHQLGDAVLKLAAKTFMDCVKGRDLPARYGGEEFAIVLPQTMLPNAVTLADQIRLAIGNKKIVNRSSGKSLGAITISIGAALYRPGESVMSFIKRADESLYMAKDEGRNRVISEEQLENRMRAAS